MSGHFYGVGVGTGDPGLCDQEDIAAGLLTA